MGQMILKAALQNNRHPIKSLAEAINAILAADLRLNRETRRSHIYPTGNCNELIFARG